MTIQKQENTTVTLLKGVLPKDGTIKVVKDSNPPAPELAETVFEAYDITLPQGSTMEGVAEIKLPFNKKLVPNGMSPEDVLSAAYFNPQENTWDSVPYLINVDQGVVTVLTNYFSKYAVVYFKDGRKKLSEKLPAFDSRLSDYSNSELEKIVGEMANGSNGSLLFFIQNFTPNS